MVAGLLVIPYIQIFNTTICLILLCLALSTLVAFDVLNWNALAGLSNRYLVSPLYLSGRGRIPILAGQCIGWLLISLTLLFAQEKNMLFISMLLIIIFSTVVVTLPRLPEKTYYLYDDVSNEERVVTSYAPNTGYWKQTCEAISREMMLSERETEIFFLLAKGRNAIYIKEKLFISQHTAKTHIYHIYKKLGVSTHQQLIDLVENQQEEKKQES